jgi:predicted DNA-binding transcriptional regulator YafY
MGHEASPTARALLALEAIQNSPGITATALGDRLAVTERAARRYVAILREADLPIESVSGPHGGYRVGRGLRLESDDEGRTRLRATTEDLDWYARQLAAIPAPFRVLASPELQQAVAALGQRLIQAGSAGQ